MRAPPGVRVNELLWNKKQLQPEPAAVREADNKASASRTEDFYSDLIVRRPSLLDERLKLHALIIDEFNLAALEKLPPDELSRQVRTYVGNYARDAKSDAQSERARYFLK